MLILFYLSGQVGVAVNFIIVVLFVFGFVVAQPNNNPNVKNTNIEIKMLIANTFIYCPLLLSL